MSSISKLCTVGVKFKVTNASERASLKSSLIELILFIGCEKPTSALSLKFNSAFSAFCSRKSKSGEQVAGAVSAFTSAVFHVFMAKSLYLYVVALTTP